MNSPIDEKLQFDIDNVNTGHEVLCSLFMQLVEEETLKDTNLKLELNVSDMFLVFSSIHRSLADESLPVDFRVDMEEKLHNFISVFGIEILQQVGMPVDEINKLWSLE